MVLCVEHGFDARRAERVLFIGVLFQNRKDAQRTRIVRPRSVELAVCGRLLIG